MVIRVSHIVDPYFGSGYSGHAHYLFSLLSGWKDDDTILDLYGPRIKPLNMNSGVLDYHVPDQSYWSKSQQFNRFGRMLWSIKLLGLLWHHRKDYDIVHFHNMNWGVLLSPYLLHLLGKKAIYTMSQFGNDNPSYIIQQKRGRWQVSLLRNFDGMIGLSPALVEDARRHGMRNVICLPNFMAIPQLKTVPTSVLRYEARSRLRIPQNKKVLLFVGSLITRKGVDILIDAFIPIAVQDPEIWLVLVGAQTKEELSIIDETYVNQQKEKIHQHNLEGNVKWTGLIREQSCLVDYYHAADIFVFPTRNEGFGNVIVEAMAAGLPVITSRLIGITDQLVSNGENGYLVEVERADLLAETIRKMILDVQKRKAMGTIGRQMALEQFGFDSYCQKLKKYYHDLLT